MKYKVETKYIGENPIPKCGMWQVLVNGVAVGTGSQSETEALAEALRKDPGLAREELEEAQARRKEI